MIGPRIEKPPGTVLTFWVIYDHPTDYPDNYVLRAQFTIKPVDGPVTIQASEVAWISDAIEPLRKLMPPGCTLFTDDNPKIAEVWME